ncbi:la-related protein 7-like [Hydractinia symbiolongicarpus]|uniref:la-related protein 7-like n=1 Tax=Hydractinia symbiolongicarpus TaxID=13093 RepID=UPI00254DB7A6|nr:la-related protein 7-like [Hydractinia symbiolongicarpus]
MENPNGKQKSGEAKKHRQRTKKLLNLIQKQLDFYFSDANLHHDRFFRKEIETNTEGYIELATILKCNKIKQLTMDMTVLAKAVENSDQLQLSDDRTKLKRIKPLPRHENTDLQTVYVEQLPAYVDHDWLKQVFSTCGTVDYISLPRYPQTNKIKGFAYVEFSNQQGAEKACQILNSAAPYKNKKRHSSLDSKLPYVEESKPKLGGKRRRSKSLSESVSEDKNCKVNILKRKRSASVSSEDSPVKPKLRKQDRNCKESKQSESQSSLNNYIHLSIKGKRSRDSSNDENENSKQVNYKTTTSGCTETCKSRRKEVTSEKKSQGDISKKKKPRKHKKTQQHINGDNDAREICVPPLYVISKTEWLVLKKQYKNLCKKEISQLKRTMKILKSEKVYQVELKEKIQKTIMEKKNSQSEKTILQSRPKHEQQHKDENTNQQAVIKNDDPALKPEKTFQVTPGTVVKMKTDSNELTKKTIKEVLSKLVQVSYVDYKDGGRTGFIRFPTADAVEKLRKVEFSTSASWNFTLTKISASIIKPTTSTTTSWLVIYKI